VKGAVAGRCLHDLGVFQPVSIYQLFFYIGDTGGVGVYGYAHYAYLFRPFEQL
jgi:hypothetical protein